jgi:tetratricopeptide (TPR) repeat protein
MNAENANEQPATAEEQELAARLVTGQITLGEYVGLNKNDLYVIAKQAYELLESGRLEEARDLYQGLVAADPYDSVFHCHLGATLLRSGEADAAFDEFNYALQFNIANGDALVGRGEIHLQRGALKEAVADLGKAIELDPDGKRVSTARAKAALLTLKDALEKQQAAA